MIMKYLINVITKREEKKRGVFVTNNGFHINADVNGAYNILRRYLKEQLNQKNNIPHCLVEDIYKNLYLTYLNIYISDLRVMPH